MSLFTQASIVTWLPYTDQQMAHDFVTVFESACLLMFICGLDLVACSLPNTLIDTPILHVNPFEH